MTANFVSVLGNAPDTTIIHHNGGSIVHRPIEDAIHHKISEQNPAQLIKELPGLMPEDEFYRIEKACPDLYKIIKRESAYLKLHGFYIKTISLTVIKAIDERPSTAPHVHGRNDLQGIISFMPGGGTTQVFETSLFLSQPYDKERDAMIMPCTDPLEQGVSMSNGVVYLPGPAPHISPNLSTLPPDTLPLDYLRVILGVGPTEAQGAK